MLVVVTNMIKVEIEKKGDFMSISKIRFKGYDNSLKRNTIGDITTSFSGGTPKSSNKTYYEGNIPFIRSGEIKSKQTELLISDEALKNSSAKMVEKGDILYALYGATSGEVAISQINGAINQAILAIKPNSGYSSEFIMNYLKKEKDNILEKYLQGGQGNLSAAIVKSIELYLPSQEEQSAIGCLFRTLDDLLASYKDNLANYQSLKATMLSKLFPKAGQTVPEIRLDGFEGEWRIIKLGDVLSELKSGLSRELSNDDIGLPVIRANNISDGNLNLDRDIKYWFKDDPKGANTANYFVRENDILVNFINSEAKMGTAAIVLREPDRETIYTTNILKLTVKEDYYPYFIYLMTFVQSYQNYIKAITKPAVNQASFTTIDFKKYEFLCPAFQEQQAISAYFLNLDNLINSHQEKITQLETLKKKLLQDMFI